MAYRGRGRGGGGGRGGYGGFGGMGHAKPAPVVLFPDVTLPEKRALSAEDKILISAKIKLENYWKTSPYYIEAASEKSQSVDIERFSDKGKPKRARRRDNLDAHLKCSSFPIELHDVLLGIRGSKQPAPKKNPETTTSKNDDKGIEQVARFEKLEQEGQNKQASDKPKKDEDEEDVEEDEENAEYSDDGDYNQTEYFDDDEDDYNNGPGSDHDDEPLL